MVKSPLLENISFTLTEWLTIAYIGTFFQLFVVISNGLYILLHACNLKEPSYQ